MSELTEVMLPCGHVLLLMADGPIYGEIREEICRRPCWECAQEVQRAK